MARYRQAPKDIVQFTAGLDRRVGALERLPRAVSTSVDKGTFQVNSGNLRIKDIADFGDLLLGDTPVRGWILYDQHGGARVYTGGNPVTGNQFINITDNQGNGIFNDDAASGQGLARPYIPWQVIKTSTLTTADVSTTATSFADFYDFHANKQHPYLRVWYYAFYTGTGNREVLYYDNLNSGQLGSTITITASGFYSDKIPVSGSHMSFQEVVMRGRVASGSGSLGVSIIAVWGEQT